MTRATCYNGGSCTAECLASSSSSCGTVSCLGAHTVGNCSNPCVSEGDPHDGGDAVCGTCSPTAAECSCEGGWYDTYGNVLNGCKGDCDSDSDGFDADTPACRDDDCDDSDPDVNPGMVEVCNYQDDDRDGGSTPPYLIDESTNCRCTVDGVSACEGSVNL